MDYNQLVRENIKALKPYSSARDEYKDLAEIKLDANENPYDSGFNRYPDPYQNKLKEAISNIKSVNKNQLFIGNGSDEAIDLLFRAFCEPGVDNVIALSPSYGMYAVSAAINNVELKEVALDEEFNLNRSMLAAAITPKTKLIFICSPNNPSGNNIPKEDIEWLSQQFDGLIVIDEAYIDFSDETSFTETLSGYPQLIVLQTLSKAYSLAGLRIGMLFANEAIVEILNKIKPPYNINEASQQIALNALTNKQSINEQIRLIKEERKKLITELSKYPSVLKVYPSSANFILVKFEKSQELFEALKEEGIIVRNRSSQAGCANCLRITIGKPEENQQLIQAIKTFYQS